MIDRSVAIAVTLVALGAIAACGEHEFHPPDREAQVAAADSLYAAISFDTIGWESPAARLASGNEVYAVHCRRCHGTLGEGDSPYAREQELDVPSLVEPDWALADSLDAVRHRIFVGHAAGMPTWGVARLTPRQIDAAAHYVLNGLRTDTR